MKRWEWSRERTYRVLRRGEVRRSGERGLSMDKKVLCPETRVDDS